MCAKLAAELEAVDRGQRQIEEDEIGSKRRCRGERGVTVVHRFRDVPHALEDFAQHVGEVGVVVDDQDPTFGSRRHERAVKPAHASDTTRIDPSANLAVVRRCAALSS
jgi:hypothetical protein